MPFCSIILLCSIRRFSAFIARFLKVVKVAEEHNEPNFVFGELHAQ
jgi:hypothetical protein